MSKATILIAGAGGIGRSVALILAEWSTANYNIHIGDGNAAVLEEALDWLRASTTKNPNLFQGFEIPFEGEGEELQAALKEGDIILDCLPGKLAPRIAGYALEYDLHYANLTEYVQETEQITKLAKDSKRGFVLQTGLAPGFINILGKSLYEQFCEEQHAEKADRMLADRICNLQAPPYYWKEDKRRAYQQEAQLIHTYLKAGNAYLAQRLNAKIGAYEQYFTHHY